VESTDFAIAFLGGLIPALFWLWFLLREDNEKPEPIGLIVLSFLSGMAVVPLVLPLQQYAQKIFTGPDIVMVWVVIEEVLKYAVALAVILWNRAVDEPIDLIIYMIAIALGFAALENALFIFTPLLANEYLNSFLIGNFRFLGSTLLHVLASGTVGVMMALAFYSSTTVKLVYGTVGLFLAIVLHALFNFFIMGIAEESAFFGVVRQIVANLFGFDIVNYGVLGVFLFVWMGIVVLFLLFEKVKILEAQHS